jgi:hypothetical protein
MAKLHTSFTILVVTLCVPPVAYAQPPITHFEVGAHVIAARSSEFEVGDAGVGGRLAWRPTTTLGVEAELNVYPGDFPDDHAFSSSRVEALFGATAGPQLGAFRPFAKARSGFLRFREPSEPIACIAIYPPPLSCTLAAGRTLFTLDLGGGFDVAVGRTAFVRADAGDRMVRYPGTVFDTDFVARDNPYFSHDFRFSVGGGIRF